MIGIGDANGGQQVFSQVNVKVERIRVSQHDEVGAILRQPGIGTPLFDGGTHQVSWWRRQLSFGKGLETILGFQIGHESKQRINQLIEMLGRFQIVVTGIFHLVEEHSGCIGSATQLLRQLAAVLDGNHIVVNTVNDERGSGNLVDQLQIVKDVMASCWNGNHRRLQDDTPY